MQETLDMNMDTLAPKEVTLEEVIAFAERNRVAANNKISKCVDGRYRMGEADGAIAFPGAHLGLSMALLAYGFAPEESFKLVYTFLQEKGENYCWHTDDHADPKNDAEAHAGHDKPVIGCGHCNEAIKDGSHYGAKAEDVRKLQEMVRAAQVAGVGMESVNLTGGHAERAVLVVTSEDYTVKSWDETTNEQFFIYDKTRHEQLITELVAHINAGVTDETKQIDTQKLIEIAWKQTQATLGLLGSSKNKPIFTVDAASEQPVVTVFGRAPQAPPAWS